MHPPTQDLPAVFRRALPPGSLDLLVSSTASGEADRYRAVKGEKRGGPSPSCVVGGCPVQMARGRPHALPSHLPLRIEERRPRGRGLERGQDAGERHGWGSLPPTPRQEGTRLLGTA